MHRIIGFWVAITTALPGSPSSAQPPEVSGNGWVVSREGFTCSAERRVPSDNALALLIRGDVGRIPLLIFASNGGSRLLPLPHSVRVAIQPANVSETGTTESTQFGRRRGSFVQLSEDFRERLLTESSIEISGQNRAPVTLQFMQLEEGLRLFNGCADSILSALGVDVSADDHLSRMPRLIDGSIYSSDYPRTAVRQRLSGDVVVRFTVGIDGRPHGCSRAYPAITNLLTQASYRLVTSRFRYEPARDADGRAVETETVFVIHWIL